MPPPSATGWNSPCTRTVLESRLHLPLRALFSAHEVVLAVERLPQNVALCISMRIVPDFRQLSSVLGTRPATALTVGVFDGMHTGHQALIRRTVGVAGARRRPSLVITFTDHPLSVLAPPY